MMHRARFGAHGLDVAKGLLDDGAALVARDDLILGEDAVAQGGIKEDFAYDIASGAALPGH
jgi:hypothetical protein